MEKKEASSLEHDTTIHTVGGFMLLHTTFHLLSVQTINVQLSIMCFYKAILHHHHLQKLDHIFLPYGKGTLTRKRCELASLLEET